MAPTNNETPEQLQETIEQQRDIEVTPKSNEQLEQELKTLRGLISNLEDERRSNNWTPPHSDSMRGEWAFLQRLYRAIRFDASTSSTELLNRLYSRQRALAIKDRYGFHVGLAVETATDALLSAKPTATEAIIEEKILSTLSKIPRLGDRQRERASFQRSRRPPKRSGKPARD
ncbi:hypothetical protein J8273_4950 [Carpediemonas membranifera]|uniref:Uncharacterized protein n=1 Tax=Carpediemonas membranifera TaxID=201153 RepID=A0A8J6B192_9EUKA|nr:hypothetical protein J8273_4950 [Carpediemonas membranifera]|eukprot:KAG9393483.1 hypothetical protein J8273_4950 [Carpediemonas membranifera]